MAFHKFILLLLAGLVGSHHIDRQLAQPCSALSSDHSASSYRPSFGTVRWQSAVNDTRTMLGNLNTSIREALYYIENMRNSCGMFASRRACREISRDILTHTESAQQAMGDDYIEIAKVWKHLEQFKGRRLYSAIVPLQNLTDKCLQIVCRLKLLIQNEGAELPSLDPVTRRNYVRVGNTGDTLTRKLAIYDHYMENFSRRNSRC